jgi:hypothetical protein
VLCHRSDIGSLRDLTQEHLPLLQGIRSKAVKVGTWLDELGQTLPDVARSSCNMLVIYSSTCRRLQHKPLCLSVVGISRCLCRLAG